jgi:putative ABC transport system permease protein
MINIIQGSISLGLLWSLMAIGVFYTYRIMNMPDLSVEGTLILGAGTAARVISEGGDPFVATFLGLGIGMLGGFVTGFLQTILKIPPILSGILTMIASYSIALRIMASPNIPLLRWTTFTVFSPMENVLRAAGIEYYRQTTLIVVAFLIALVTGILLYCFAGTEIGSAMRATGNNRQMSKAQGVNTGVMVVLCLMISNGLVGLTGALIAQQQGSADISMGVGTIIAGLASVIIAEVLFKVRSFWMRLISLVCGSIVYRLIIALVLEMGMDHTDLRLFQAITVAFALTLPMLRDKIVELAGKARVAIVLRWPKIRNKIVELSGKLKRKGE